jgi:hypothetical protein
MTALYDAIAVALRQLQSGSREKKGLVAISDGGDNASVHKLPQILKFGEQSGAIIYTVGIFDEDDADVTVDGFHYAHADRGPAIVGDPVQVFHQRMEFLEGLQPLPLS